MNRHDFLVEIGAEEMPPKSLVALGESFRDGVVAGLDAAGLSHGAAQAYFTPRRLAVLVQKLLDRQPEQRVERRGPPVSAAFDAAGTADARGDRLRRILRRRRRRTHAHQRRQGRIPVLPHDAARSSRPRSSCRASCRPRSISFRSRGACAGARARPSSSAPCTGSSCCTATTSSPARSSAFRPAG